jgi:NADH-quinone oxidoreductase subunit L
MLTIFAIIPLAAAALVALLLRNRRASGYVALAASLLSLIFVLYLLADNPGPQSMTWFSVSGLTLGIGTSLQPLNVLLLLLVAVVTPIALVYSLGFMTVPSEQGRYYFGMCLSAAAMMLLAVSSDFITLLMGWELLSLSSYLLIGFWYRSERAQDAARKSMTSLLIGDILMFAAILLVWNAYGTLSFSAALQGHASPAVAVALVLIMAAAFTKSAQFPFHEWLPDAVESPVPSSAFMLSSTVAKAGVFLLAVLLPLFAMYGLLNIMVIFGAITALLGVSNALAETRIKRLLAYSTMENLGLMTVALGLNALTAAMLLFVAQTFYTALLFMCAGAMIRANDNEDDIYRLRGPHMRTPFFIAMLIGVVSVAGVLPLSGFFASSSIAAAASSSSLPVYLVLLLAGLAGSVYIFKWLFVPMRPGARSALKGMYGALPKSFLVPIYALAVLAVISIFAYLYLPAFLNAHGTVALGMTLESAALESIVALAGLALAYGLYMNASPYNLKAHRRLYSALYNGAWVSIFYLGVARAALAVSRAVYTFDRALSVFMRGVTSTAARLGSVLRIMVDGREDLYASVFVLGVIAAIALFIVW